LLAWGGWTTWKAWATSGNNVRFSVITKKDLCDRGNYLKFLVIMSSDNEIGLIILPMEQEAHQVLQIEVFNETFSHGIVFIFFVYNKVSVKK
jgi:hypothetical protein